MGPRKGKAAFMASAPIAEGVPVAIAESAGKADISGADSCIRAATDSNDAELQSRMDKNDKNMRAVYGDFDGPPVAKAVADTGSDLTTSKGFDPYAAGDRPPWEERPRIGLPLSARPCRVLTWIRRGRASST